MKEQNSICILVAMGAEAAPIIDRFGASRVDRDDRIAPLEFYVAGLPGGTNLVIATSGKDRRTGVDNVGPQAATLNSYHCAAQGVDLIINAGTAGGLPEKGAGIGDVYLGYPSVSYHDRRIPLPDFEEYGRGCIPTPELSDIARELGFKTGKISTGSSLDHTDIDLETINRHGAVIKDMEAAAIAWVCEIYRVPLIVLKSITDLVGAEANTPEQFVENLGAATENMTEAVVQLVAHLTRIESSKATWPALGLANVEAKHAGGFPTP